MFHSIKRKTCIFGIFITKEMFFWIHFLAKTERNSWEISKLYHKKEFISLLIMINEDNLLNSQRPFTGPWWFPLKLISSFSIVCFARPKICVTKNLLVKSDFQLLKSWIRKRSVFFCSDSPEILSVIRWFHMVVQFWIVLVKSLLLT